MPREKTVKISKDGNEATVMASSVPMYERHGWTVADDGSSGEDATESAPAPAKKTSARKKAE